MHLSLLNRGCLIAPFHNMMLTSPATTDAQVEALSRAFFEATARLVADIDRLLAGHRPGPPPGPVPRSADGKIILGGATAKDVLATVMAAA